MVFLDLIVNCDCENVETLITDANHEWHLTIKCTQCQQTHNDEIYFTSKDEIEIPGSRGTANFLMTCQFCKKNKLVISLDPSSPLQVPLSDKAYIHLVNNQILATFEVRGADLITWNCQNLKVKAADSKTVFEDVDLSDTWMEYDDETKNNCMIDNFKAGFQRSKKK